MKITSVTIALRPSLIVRFAHQTIKEILNVKDAWMDSTWLSTSILAISVNRGNSRRLMDHVVLAQTSLETVVDA